MLSTKTISRSQKNISIIKKPLIFRNISINNDKKFYNLVKRKTSVLYSPSVANAPDVPSFLFENSIIFIGMPLTEITIELLFCQLLWQNNKKSKKYINFIINSYGSHSSYTDINNIFGSYLTLIDLIEFNSYQTNSIVIGKSFGTALFLFLTSSTNKRIALENSSFSFETPFLYSSTRSLSNLSNSIIEFNTFINYMKEKFNYSLHYNNSLLQSKRYFNSKEALEIGIIDEIFTSKNN
ncbi:Clp protease (nucleomorph) [Bigelowiella natans]|uniref:ATP-dependent Clp protease proteolytic subunit n=1 Tax=Bigelowiella natans TaxID=227086 RepID=Q3LWK4_BIGNA|nr:Clp protease [Bigelowiella natans]ABA27162.1 Clp protease [Bigelowiella natans]